jgi:DNA-directed RNA polymerase specialized sigma24 family protein
MEIMLETDGRPFVRRGNKWQEWDVQRQALVGRAAPAEGGCARKPRAGADKWQLNQDAFTSLLARLDEDPERAGEKYVGIYQKLGKYFECRGCASPEELTDETVNRVARRIREGVEIPAEHPIKYFYGVARNVLREQFAQQRVKFLSLDELTPPEIPFTRPRELGRQERMLEWISQCLRKLAPEDRELLLEYEHEQKLSRIEHRRRMAMRLGTTANALRLRIFRIRESLERYVVEQMRDA